MTLITIKAPYSESIVITLRDDSKRWKDRILAGSASTLRQVGEKLNYLNRVNRYFGIGQRNSNEGQR
jgi:hypothetical protein